ncbi:V-set and transmembrane domain-containing protein 4a isoform X1 [Paralichthys olivaceus]|uniref:V-set and transmembrane domain-containing protein 4a isoform X1 n=2 Tax=Paralichthys olivaceus TaxID=8255 RepID=UPI00097E159E|nr:PREDICTED: V-set and transmembrane domain-containing protein 4-like isoform X1 [Paralichthys olivaceus]
MYFSIVVLVLTKALVTDVCHALNVTLTPGPVVMVTEKDNVTLSCLVSQRKRSSSVLILRWFFSPLAAPTLLPPPSSPSPSPPALDPSQFLIVKMGIKKMKLYGNYTRRFPQPKFRLYEEAEGELYRLRIFSVAGADQGFYTCKVQEIRKYRNTWRSSSNGTSTTQLTVHFTLEDSSSEGLWRLFADVYLYAVLICSLGLLSIFLFTLVLTCQYFHRRHRLKASYLLVKCPESSSGETVTSSSSSSSSSPRAQRKDTRQKTDRRVAVTPPKLPVEPPPHIPAKVPVPAKRPQKPRRLKTQPRRSAAPRVSQEDSLTYAELELVRPRPEPQAYSTTPDPAPSSPDTVYAQILFQERQL